MKLSVVLGSCGCDRRPLGALDDYKDLSFRSFRAWKQIAFKADDVGLPTTQVARHNFRRHKSGRNERLELA